MSGSKLIFCLSVQVADRSIRMNVQVSSDIFPSIGSYPCAKICVHVHFCSPVSSMQLAVAESSMWAISLGIS